MSLPQRDVPRDAFAELSCFRTEFYACLAQRPDALFELSDALLCGRPGEDVGRAVPGT